MATRLRRYPNAALLSPSTALIKASGGRQEGWTEQEEEETRMCDWLIYVTEQGGGGHHLIILTPGFRGFRRTKKACLKVLKENPKRKQKLEE